MQPIANLAEPTAAASPAAGPASGTGPYGGGPTEPLAGVHPLIAGRWSPRAFDPTHWLGDHDLMLLFEAARWAPSGGNGQPWQFVAGRRGDPTHALLLDSLLPLNQRWAGRASVLVAALASEVRDDGRPNRWASYDLGGAVAHLTLQAEHLGLRVHQMAGFDADRLRAALHVPAGLAVFTVLAIGALGDPAHLPDDLRAREVGPWARRPLGEVVRHTPWPAGA